MSDKIAEIRQRHERDMSRFDKPQGLLIHQDRAYLLNKVKELEARLDFNKRELIDKQKYILNLESKLRIFVWAENNPSEYVTELEAAEAKTKKLEEQLEKVRPYIQHDPMCGKDRDPSLRCICGLQAILEKE